MNELLQKILYLVTKANFVIREEVKQGELPQAGWSFHRFGNLWVMWEDANPMPCPTQAQLNAIDMPALALKVEADRKSNRDKQYAKDLSMKAAFRAERKGNPNLTFSDFLNALESEIVV